MLNYKKQDCNKEALQHFDGKPPHLQAVIMTVNNINET